VKDFDSQNIIVSKNEGELLSELISRTRIEKNISNDISITYAGRLDPMASGLVLLLTGENVYKKDDYLKLSKTYEVEILFGISSDTEDALGMIDWGFSIPDIEEIKRVIEIFPHEYEQEYPDYSSKTVAGIPLFVYAREGRVVTKQKHFVKINKIKIKSKYKISGNELAKQAIGRVLKVNGDFRQNEIIKSWKNFGEKESEKNFLVLKVVVESGGGTYMRTLAKDIARSVDTKAIAWKICRTKINILK